MSKKKREYEFAPAQIDQFLYTERLERVIELLEEQNELLQQLATKDEPKTTTKKATASKKEEDIPEKQ